MIPLPPIGARYDPDWTRCVDRAKKGITKEWVSDELFLDAVEACIDATHRLKSLEKTIPFGSTWFGLDVRLNGIRRSRKKLPAGNAYDRDLEFMKFRQKERLRALKIDASDEYYAVLFHKKKEVSYIHREREKRLREFLLKMSGNLLLKTMCAWRNYARALKKARHLFAKNLVSTSRSVFFAWRTYSRRSLRVKKMRRKIFSRLARFVFEDWHRYTCRRRYLRDLLKIWRTMTSHMKDQRMKIAHFMLRGNLSRVFCAWHRVALFERKARHFAQRRHLHSRTLTFMAWKKHFLKMVQVKVAVKELLCGCLTSHFQAWKQYTLLSAKTRNFVNKSLRAHCLTCLRAWRHQARLGRLTRLGLMDDDDDSGGAADSLLQAFYKARHYCS